MTREERREGAQLVTQGEGGILSLPRSGVEEGPGVAPRERASGARHTPASRARGPAAHTMLGMALCLASMVRACGRPGGAQGASTKAPQDTTAALSWSKTCPELEYTKTYSKVEPPSGAPGGTLPPPPGLHGRQSPWKNAPSSTRSFGETSVASTRQPESSSMRWRPCTCPVTRPRIETTPQSILRPPGPSRR